MPNSKKSSNDTSQNNELNAIAETDFYALGDVTMSDSIKTYRQALRDITSQTPTDIELSNMNWPTKPS